MMRLIWSFWSWRICPKCSNNKRTVWRDGNPVCQMCDLDLKQ